MEHIDVPNMNFMALRTTYEPGQAPPSRFPLILCTSMVTVQAVARNAVLLLHEPAYNAGVRISVVRIVMFVEQGIIRVSVMVAGRNVADIVPSSSMATDKRACPCKTSYAQASNVTGLV